MIPTAIFHFAVSFNGPCRLSLCDSTRQQIWCAYSRPIRVTKRRIEADSTRVWPIRRSGREAAFGNMHPGVQSRTRCCVMPDERDVWNTTFLIVKTRTIFTPA
jgi:hypothetical protein